MNRKKFLLISGVTIIFLILIFSLIIFLVLRSRSSTSDQTVVDQNILQVETDTLDDSEAETEDSHDEISNAPDYTKLPLGDGKYSTSPKKGYVYSCNTNFNGGGAFKQGPWIDTESGTWNLLQKVSVDGSVEWTAAYWVLDFNGDSRVIKSADLPVNHPTGNYPVATNDDAYQYDRNPNSIKQQSIDFSVPKNPTLLSNPECVGGEVGIALSGVLIFNAFDAAGRDAVATEIQDDCEGHPQAGGYYHYHGYSDCLEDNSAEGEHSDLVGYAFDGFGIFGLKGEKGIELSTEDLDECHGHTHEIEWDGPTKEMYHYHMTQDFPYTVGCFRGKASVKALSSGEGGAMTGAGGMQSAPQIQQQPQPPMPTGPRPPR